jgi:CheY-like chemotaxis protein
MTAVLVVDDEPTIADLLMELLRDEGYETMAATDGLMALEALQAGPPVDVVITDAMMPRCGGVELVQRMREQPQLRAIPVIVLSAGMRPVLDGLGATRFLPKPFELTALLGCISEAFSDAPP